MIGYIYLTTNLINNKKYIGKRQKSKFDESYLGSGKHLKAAVLSYGKENFKCEILKWCRTKEELNESEKEFIAKYNAVNDANFYNLSEGGEGGNTGAQYKGMKPHIEHHSPETKLKMSQSRKGHLTSQETRHKISISNTGKKRTPEQNKANSERNKNKVWIRKDDIQKTIPLQELNDYLLDGWEKGRLKNKKPAWNKGLTKDTNPSLLEISNKRKELFKNNNGVIGCYGLKGELNKNSRIYKSKISN